MKQKNKKIILGILFIATFLTILSTRVYAISQAGEDINGQSDAVTKVPYTIEDLIFNRIPAFDINVFSDKAGGKTVEEGSVIYIIRNTIKIWYYSMRNVALVFTIFMIVFLGVKIAISTVANDKAKYKQTIVECLKAIVLIMVIHYLMIFIISLNETFTGLLQNVYGTENSIYLTIKTRAYDVRFSIGIPAAIMYLALVIFFIRFVYVYFKREYTVLLLIVMAPLIVIKYLWDNINGKGDVIINNWINDFISATFIQTIHALLYTILMGIAVKLATTNISGFILALIFINFIIKSGDIIESMFSFRGGKSNFIGDVKSPFNAKKDMELFIEARQLYQFGVGTTKALANGIAKPISRGVSNYFDERENNGDSTLRSSINKGLNSIDQATLNYANRYRENQSKAIEEMLKNNQINGRTLTDKEREKYENKLAKKQIKQENFDSRIMLRMNSRKHDKQGEYARKLIKKSKTQRNARFTGNVKFIKDATTGIIQIGIGIPLMTSDLGLGLATLTGGYEKLKSTTETKKKYTLAGKTTLVATAGISGMYKNRMEKEKDDQDDRNKIKKTIKYINTANSKLDKIEKDLRDIKDNEPDKANRYLSQLLKINGQDINNYEITSDISSFMYKNSANALEQIEISKTKKMVKDIIESKNDDVKLDDKTKSQTINTAQQQVEEIINKKKQLNEEYDSNVFINDVASAIGDALLRGQTDDEDLIKFAKATNEVKDINSNSEDDTDNKVADVTSFLKRIQKN